MDFSELRDLDFKNIGSAPAPIKLGVLIVVVAAILIGGYFYIIKDKREQLETAQRVEQDLQRDFQKKQQQAANLDAYVAQLAEMEEMLESMLRKLPSKTEMPELLMDISQTALGAGIDNELFEPQTEVMRNFYVEQPIKVRMVGSYHQFGNFVGSVASLSRVVILTMRDISLQPVDGARGRLRLEGVITTYRYLDASEGGATGTGGAQ